MSTILVNIDLTLCSSRCPYLLAKWDRMGSAPDVTCETYQQPLELKQVSADEARPVRCSECIQKGPRPLVVQERFYGNPTPPRSFKYVKPGTYYGYLQLPPIKSVELAPPLGEAVQKPRKEDESKEPILDVKQEEPTSDPVSLALPIKLDWKDE